MVRYELQAKLKVPRPQSDKATPRYRERQSPIAVETFKNELTERLLELMSLPSQITIPIPRGIESEHIRIAGINPVILTVNLHQFFKFV